MSYIIAVANQKGGVAKTTTAVSLGGALVKNGYQVLLIDLDAQADLTLGMGLNPRLIRGSIADVLLSTNSISSLCRETNIPGLDLIPSNSEMDLAEQFLPVRKNYEFILRSALANQLPANTYDTIILDCPPALGAVTYNALNAAHLFDTNPTGIFFSPCFEKHVAIYPSGAERGKSCVAIPDSNYHARLPKSHPPQSEPGIEEHLS
jgi:chromosome partitioning protein